jgi:hypothetical protein
MLSHYLHNPPGDRLRRLAAIPLPRYGLEEIRSFGRREASSKKRVMPPPKARRSIAKPIYPAFPPTARTSENANSTTFIILHRSGVLRTFVAPGAFSNGTRSPKKAANRPLSLFSLLFLATGSNSERITSRRDACSVGASVTENSRLLPDFAAAKGCAIVDLVCSPLRPLRRP